MIDLFLVRHGPTHAKGMVGWSDLPADLSDLAALDRLAAQLPADAPVISSDLVRAVTTADAIQRDRPRLPHDPALREMHFGDWELRGHAELSQNDPERIQAFIDAPTEIRPPGGETWEEARARASRVIDRLAQDHAAGALIVVAHFGVILGQLQRARGMDAEKALTHRIDPLSVTEMHWARGGWTPGRINHLP